ncbi:MAG: branched-chain amino acid ABC transporter permease, partial [Spirochaetota bacterium]
MKLNNNSIFSKILYFFKRRIVLFLIASIIVMLIIMLLHTFDILNSYIIQIINVSLVYVILAVSLNLINGFTGQFSIGHMGFAAVGAYTSATITTLLLKITPTSLPNYIIFILALLAGGCLAGLTGFISGFPSLRLKGDYLAIMTLGFGEIIRTIFNNINFVGGPRGLLGIPKFSTFPII